MAQTFYTSYTAARAGDFINTLGVGAHLKQTWLPYGNATNVVNDFSYLGVKHIRDGIDSVSITPLSEIQQLAALGIQFAGPIENAETYHAALDQYASYFDALEGPNEVDIDNQTYNSLTGIPAGVAIQQDLYTTVKNDPLLASKPVYNLSLATPANSPQLTATATYADYSNLHDYVTTGAHGLAPYQYTPNAIAATVDSPGKPFVITETGFSTANPANPPPAYGIFVNEDVQAKYLLDEFFDNFNSGILKTDIYELFDEQLDVTNTNTEYHFGLFRYDNSPKPIAIAIHNLTTLLQDSAATARTFTPGTLSYAIQETLTTAGMDISSRQLVLQKSNGYYDIIVWAEPALWSSGSSPAEITSNPPNIVSINFPDVRASINVYDPMTGTTPTTSYSNAQNVDLAVVDHPLIIEVGPSPPVCGSAAGVAVATGPSGNLCQTGSPSTPLQSGGNWIWSCTINGLSPLACAAPVPLAGSCGQANNTILAAPPTTGFCGTGRVLAVEGSQWTWTCNGNNGVAVLCRAYPQDALPQVLTTTATTIPATGIRTPTATAANNSQTKQEASTSPVSNAKASVSVDGYGNNAQHNRKKQVLPVCGAVKDIAAAQADPSVLCDSGTPSQLSYDNQSLQWSCTANGQTANCSVEEKAR